jgi:hypothetical protein
MIGVAMPGIAPGTPPVDGPVSPQASTVAVPLPPYATAAISADSVSGAPLPPRRNPALTLPLQVQYVPPPAPLRELPVPAPPRITRKKGGLSLAAVALVLGAVLLAGGVLVAVLWKGAPPISGQPRATADGKDVLHLMCDAKSCRDGTIVAFGGVKATFAAGEVDLPLASPLRVGDNTLELMIDRPGMGRDEIVKLVVPVAYRVRADVTTMTDPHPSITVRVEAQPGSDVRVDGKPLALDAAGTASYPVDEAAATEGPADESRVISLDVPYEILPPSAKERTLLKGTVSARVSVAPLRVDAPGAHAVVEDDKVLIAGRAAKGSTVTVDGTPVNIAPDGSFETTVALPAEGDRTIDVRGGTSSLVPRVVHVGVSRVAHLADAAKAFEQQKTLGYDTVMSDILHAVGQPIVVEGTVLEARGLAHRTLALVDDKRGCARRPCLVRLVVGHEVPLARGEALKGYGVVARPFTTPAGQTVPEVEAAFVLGNVSSLPDSSGARTAP